MNFFLVIFLTIAHITIVLSGGCQNNDSILVLIESLNGNLLCLILQFLPLHDYQNFFKIYMNEISSKKLLFKFKQCLVQYEQRFYGHYEGVQEFFHFHSNYQGQVNLINRWFPKTVKQFATFSFESSAVTFLFETILYKNGFFDLQVLLGAKQMKYKKPFCNIFGWNENVQSFFIQELNFRRTDNPLLKISLFKKDGTLFIFNLEMPYTHFGKRTPKFTFTQFEKPFISMHNLSPSFYLTINSNKNDIHFFPKFHLFSSEIDRTSHTNVCIDDIPGMNSIEIHNNATTDIQEIEIEILNQKHKMNMTHFFNTYVKNCRKSLKYRLE
jgi:hypothetical protein